MRFRTESNTVYEIDGLRVRRVAGTGSEGMRRDGDWLDLEDAPVVVLGRPVTLILEPLGEGDVTIRTTTPVVSIHHDKETPDEH